MLLLRSREIVLSQLFQYQGHQETRMQLSNLLWSLPEGLIGSHVMGTFVLKNLVNLDSACATRNNRQHLRSLFSMTIVNLAPCPGLSCLQWILCCGFKVDRMVLNEDHIDALLMVANANSKVLNLELSYDMLKLPPVPPVGEEVKAPNVPSEVADLVTSLSVDSRSNCVAVDYPLFLLDMTQFRNIKILHCVCTTDSEEQVAQLIKNSHLLSCLKLHWQGFGSSLNSSMIAAIQSRSATLVEVNLRFSCCVTDTEVALLVENCPGVQRLRIEAASFPGAGAQLCSDVGVAAIAQCCPELRELTLRGIAPSEASLVQVVTCCRKLHKLDALDAVLTDTVLLALAQASSESIEGRCSADGRVPRPAKREHITVLCATWSVEKCDTISRCAFFFQHMQSFSARRLNPRYESASMIAALSSAVAACTQLHTLNLQIQSFRDGADVLAAVAKGCGKLRRLRVLGSIGEDCAVAMTAIVENCHMLEGIILSREDVVTDQLLDKIATCLPRLRQLECCGQKVTSRGLMQLGRFPQLRRVSMQSCSAVDSDLTPISKGCPFLESLDMPGCVFEVEKLWVLIDACKHLTDLALFVGVLSPTEEKALMCARKGLKVEFIPHFDMDW